MREVACHRASCRSTMWPGEGPAWKDVAMLPSRFNTTTLPADV
jgi:hypothetical protein